MAGIKNKGAGVSSVKRKQLLVLGGLVAAVAGISMVAAMVSSPKKPVAQKTVPNTKKSFGALEEKVSSADVWRAQEGAQILQLQEQLNKLQAKLDSQERTPAAEAAKSQAESEASGKRETPLDLASLQLPPAPSMEQPNTAIPPPQMQPEMTPQQVLRGIMRLNFEDKPAIAPDTKGDATKKTVAANPDSASSSTGYIPAGSFMRGVLLSGLDAATGGQAQQNPQPVVIEVIDMTSLPNKFKADYKACRVTANGAGDLSSERAYIRLDRLSCVAASGDVIDVAVKGYVADQSGKIGVRGRLVSKQGQVLANALQAGIASGIGTAFSQSNTVSSVSPLGMTQSLKDGKTLDTGIGHGVGKALEQLSKYYMDLADKMFPIIEVDAGQAIDIVFTQGVSLQ